MIANAKEPTQLERVGGVFLSCCKRTVRGVSERKTQEKSTGCGGIEEVRGLCCMCFGRVEIENFRPKMMGY